MLKDYIREPLRSEGAGRIAVWSRSKERQGELLVAFGTSCKRDNDAAREPWDERLDHI